MNTAELTKIIELRKELHKIPELSGFEHKTAKRIQKFIAKNHPTEILENLGGKGVAAIYKFPNKGRSVTIRCELDALPIEEENQFKHKSKIKGVSHKCGHDGHMAIVSGLIFWLKQQRFASGEVILLFQPAEENGEGAYRIINDNKFKKLKTDYIFALHNIPKEPLHDIIFIKKGFSAEVESFIIKVRGKQSHAAEPEKGINPALAISQIISNISNFERATPEDRHFSLITPIHINMGQKSYGISPSDGELHYTLRTWDVHRMTTVKQQIKKVVEELCLRYGLEYSLEWIEYFPASINDKKSNSYVVKAAKENNYTLVDKPYPFKFGEDFGWFSKTYKTAMFGLGAGVDTPALHSSDYDFPDEIIESGINMFKSIISNILHDEQ